MQLQAFDLTPAQYKRANILTAQTINFIYAVLIYLIWAEKEIATRGKIIYTVILVAWYLLTAIVVTKRVTEKIAMLMLSIGFEMSYMMVVMVTGTPSLPLVFPVLVMITVYMNQKLLLWGSGSALILTIAKAVILVKSGNFTALDIKIIIVMFLGIMICLIGGMSAVKALIQFSNDSTHAVTEALKVQEEISAAVEKVASEVSNEFTTAMDSLKSINLSVDDATVSIEQIATGSEKSADAISTQATMTSEIQNRLASTNQTSENAKDITQSLKKNIENGKQQSDRLKQQSVIVDDYTTQISDSINKLVDSVNSVSNITDAILSISNQTNLLALNASIEAARAGEAGKGFAVVADQIRKLSEETKQSTEQITEIMRELSNITNETQESLKGTVESIDIQRENVELVYENFVSVDQGINELATGVDSMNNEVNMVVSANDQIVESISSLASMSEQMSAEAKSSSDGMSNLKDSMGTFTSVLEKTSGKMQELMDSIKK